MRSSSIKTVFAVLSLVLTLSAAAPATQAAPAPRTRQVAPASRGESRDFDRAIEAVRRFLRRFTGGFTANDGPTSGGTTIPIPPPDSNGH